MIRVSSQQGELMGSMTDQTLKLLFMTTQMREHPSVGPSAIQSPSWQSQQIPKPPDHTFSHRSHHRPCLVDGSKDDDVVTLRSRLFPELIDANADGLQQLFIVG